MSTHDSRRHLLLPHGVVDEEDNLYVIRSDLSLVAKASLLHLSYMELLLTASDTNIDSSCPSVDVRVAIQRVLGSVCNSNIGCILLD